MVQERMDRVVCSWWSSPIFSATTRPDLRAR